MDKEQEFEHILNLRADPPPKRSNLEHRIIQSALLGENIKDNKFSTNFDSLTEKKLEASDCEPHVSAKPAWLTQNCHSKNDDWYNKKPLFANIFDNLLLPSPVLSLAIILVFGVFMGSYSGNDILLNNDIDAFFTANSSWIDSNIEYGDFDE